MTATASPRTRRYRLTAVAVRSPFHHRYDSHSKPWNEPYRLTAGGEVASLPLERAAAGGIAAPSQQIPERAHRLPVSQLASTIERMTFAGARSGHVPCDTSRRAS